MSEVKRFVKSIVEQARGPVNLDRRSGQDGQQGGNAAARGLTERNGDATRRVFCCGFDTVGGSEAVVR